MASGPVPLLASGRTSAAEAGIALGKSKTVAYEYLAVVRAAGIADRTGRRPGPGWQLPARPAVPAGKRGEVPVRRGPAAISRYVTVEALAQAAHDGLVDVDDDTRAVLEQARRIRTGRTRRPHLTVVPDPESDGA